MLFILLICELWLVPYLSNGIQCHVILIMSEINRNITQEQQLMRSFISLYSCSTDFTSQTRSEKSQTFQAIFLSILMSETVSFLYPGSILSITSFKSLNQIPDTFEGNLVSKCQSINLGSVVNFYPSYTSSVTILIISKLYDNFLSQKQL